MPAQAIPCAAARRRRRAPGAAQLKNWAPFAEIVEPLADALGGAVGATRDAVDEGFYDAAYQIGQTGVTVSPDLYIGLGISGAIQHTSGMQTSGTIVVVNQDQDEPFFQIADLGVVGDLHEIAPALTEELKARQ